LGVYREGGGRRVIEKRGRFGTDSQSLFEYVQEKRGRKIYLNDAKVYYSSCWELKKRREEKERR
jgi:hypothetical protein